MERRGTFDAVAGLYALVRPGYPDALFEDLGELAGLSPAASVLEIGCGAGQATAALAARAGRVVAIDPGANLLAEAQARIGAAHVAFVLTLFEDYEDEPGSFDLVASAQAWHWIAPDLGPVKAAALLADGGWLAVFGHVPMPVSEPFASLFQRQFERFAPGRWGKPPPQTAYLPGGLIGASIETSSLFGPIIHRRYLWRWSMTSQVLDRYLRTDSSYSDLPLEQREGLFAGMRDAVASRGDLLDTPWETHLYAAQKR